ncbi:glutamate--tRNA ligase [Oesophagostomum dentatum]|uniref:Nondiscriminating glutamyl-tRNA synthetase EARS2, mitochondrial n=1 Tax=Oesophagostomum dentatum TaxID=61180 RepID=A0A0B1TJ92_OESDE|nr:glutamate--tRNA ligase [Oesophagostomum dentatum]
MVFYLTRRFLCSAGQVRKNKCNRYNAKQALPSFFLQVRVRFAPSPTGHLHLGGLRTALYNFLFARHHKGSFILRIEDTDKARLVPGSAEEIERVLSHYGLDYDEGPSKVGAFGPYVQSHRLQFYKDAVDQLIDSGHAYRCFCSEERLALLRKDAVRRNAVPKYDMKCRSVTKEESEARAANGEPFVVRFKLDRQNVYFEDDVYGSIEQYIDESDMVLLKTDGFPTYHLANIVDDCAMKISHDDVYGSIEQYIDESDMVLLKTDGFPTYHLANIVDDCAMKISHVIRGMEWLSSTGKHVLLYKAFGWQHPRFLHLPLITRDGKKKLSKRDKDAFVDFYEHDLGALPEAVLNSLIRNGSGIRDFDAAHLYSLKEMIAMFDEKEIGRRNLQLDQECLERYGRMSIQAADNDSVLLPAIRKMIGQKMSTSVEHDDAYLRKVIQFLKQNEEKFAFLSMLTSGEFRWFLTKPATAEQVLSLFDKNSALEALELLEKCGSLEIDSLKKLALQLGWPYPQLMKLVRICLIDSTKGPPISELVTFFGIGECQIRLHQMIEYIRSHTTLTSKGIHS